MRDKKIFIVIILILLIIIFGILIFINILKKNNEKEEYIIRENPRITTTLDVMELISMNEFFTVESCVNKYFKTLDENDNDSIYSLLNNKYIDENGITSLNLTQKTYQLKDGFEEFFAKDIYYRELSYDKEKQYYIYGEILGDNYNTIRTVYIIANLDYENMSFNITLPQKIEMDQQEYLTIIEDLKSGNTDEIIYVDEQEKTEDIVLNENNAFEENVSENPYSLDHYLKNYTTMAVYYPDIAFNLLDEEYRNKKFKSIDEYKQFVLDNKYRLLNTTIKEYSIFEKEGYYQYVISDTRGNYYIFKVTDIMKYTIIPDFYTIELEEIINNYDNSNVQERVAINIQKIVSALNSKDYKYVYDKLDDGFKANKYSTFEAFKKYMSTVIVGNPELKLGEFRNEGETYIYNIVLESARASADEPVNMQIIMQLKENRDFVMSFSVK